MSSRSTRWRRILGAGALLAVAALVLGGLGVFPQEPLRRLAEARLKAAVGDGSAIGGLRVVPFLLKAEVRDLRLEGRGYTLIVPEGRVVLAPRALTGELALQRLEVDSPSLGLTAEEEETPPDATPATPVPMEIEAVVIRNGSLRWTAPETGELRVDGLSAEGGIGRGSLTLEAARATWRGESTLEAGPARARFSISRDLDVGLDSSETRLGASTLRASGALARRGEMALGLDLAADLDLSDGGSALGLPELSGAIEGTGRLEGSGDDLRVSVEAGGSAGWGPWSADDLVLRLEAHPGPGRVRASLRGRALGGSFEGETELDGEETRGRLRSKGIDFAQLPPEMRLPVSVSGAEVEVDWEGPLDGPVHLEAVARGRGWHEAGTGRLETRARGSVRLDDGEADLAWSAALEGETSSADVVELGLEARGRWRGAWPPEVTGDLAGTVNAKDGLPEDQLALAGSFRVHGDDAQARLDATGLFDLSVESRIRGERIQALSLTAEGVNLARLGPPASGRASLRLEAAGPLRTPEVSVQVSVDALEWDGVSLGRFEAGADGNTDRAELRAALPDLSIGADGELQAFEGGARLRGRAELHETSLARLGAVAGVVDTPSGHVTATLGFDVPLARWAEGEATLDVQELVAVYEERPLRVQPFRAELRGGRLGFRDVRVEGEGVSLDVSASAGFTDDAAVEVRAWLDAELGVLPLPEGWSLSGTLSGALGLSGTRARPSFEGALHAGDLIVRGPGFPVVEIDDVEVHLGDDGLSLPRFEARVGEAGRATLEGEVPYPAVWPALRGGDLAASDRASLSAAWHDVAVAPVEGGLDGELSLTGGLASLEELIGEVRLGARSLILEGLTLELPPALFLLEGGRVTTDAVTVRSAPGDLVVSGGADLLQETLDVRARGDFALGLLSRLAKDASIGGTAQVDVTLRGPFAAPVPRGSVSVDGVSVRVRALPQAVTGIHGRVDLDGSTAVLAATGSLGGGDLKLEGEAQATGTGLGDLWLQLTGRDVALRYPPGLRSRLDVDLTLAGRAGDLTLAGGVGVKGGVYEIDAAMRDALRAPTPESATGSDILRDVALDVTVDLVRPVAVQSGFGRVEATGRITARGDLMEPAPFGRLDVRRGGRIDLQGRELTITGGAITYAGTWNGDLSLSGETVVPNVEFNDRSLRDLRVRASLRGSLEQPSLVLSSEPALSRQEIVSAIATGRLQSSLVDSSAWLLGGQAATLVSGQLTRRVAQTFGLDEITVRPDLVARETDPSARFTFGKRIGRPLALIYSAGLGGPETRYAEMRVSPGYKVLLRGLRTDAGTHELGLGQRFEFGGPPPDDLAPSSGERLVEVRFEGAPLEESLRGSVRLRTGKRVADWRVQQEAERLRSRLREQGQLDAEVAARLEGGVAVFTVEPGPMYAWRVEGMADPPSLDRVLARSLFEADAVDLGRSRLLEVLGQQGHLGAGVETSVAAQGDDRREILFTVEPGPRYDPVEVRFPGAKALSRSALLVAAGGASGLFSTPDAAVRGMQEAYRGRHFLAARVGVPQVERQGHAITLTVPVDEGAPARLLWVRAEGATHYEAELTRALSLPTGVPFAAEMATEAVARTRAVYLSHGYSDARIRPELAVEGQDLGLLLRVREGDPRVIESLTLSGNTRTKGWLVERALDLDPGEPLDPRRLGEAERRLLRLGTFARSAIVPDPENPGALTVDVQEAANLSLAYDARWDDEAGWSGLVDGLASNVLGLGVGLGGRVRYGGRYREYRGSLHLPAALAVGDVTGSVFRTEEDIPADDFEIVRRQTGFQIQHSIGRPSRLEALVGYRFRRNLTLAPTLPEIPIDVGGLDLSLLRTTQDDLLDPRQGAFWSLNVNLAPSWLGSDAPLVKGYAQAVLTRSFRDDTFSWAQSYRLGLARGLDGEPVIASERFRAGGASSLRGFGTNEVGPRGFFGEPTGGEAVAIMNQEIRYHHRWGVGLVGFYDVGNVFPTVEGMTFDFRQTLGAGLRWSSPVGLLRVDLGFPLDRQPEEKSYRLFFGIGQAF